MLIYTRLKMFLKGMVLDFYILMAPNISLTLRQATDYSKTMAFKENVRWNHKIKCIPSQKRKEKERKNKKKMKVSEFLLQINY